MAKQPDMNSAIAEANTKIAKDAAAFDPVKLERANSKQQQKNNWTRNEKIVLAAVIVGIAAIVVLVVKYGKDCVRSRPAGCNPVTEEGCVCEEYEQRR